MLRNIQGWPLVIIILAIIILVGWKRLPDAARSVGRSMRIFKSEVEQMTNKDDDPRSAASSDTVDGRPGPAKEDGAGQEGRARGDGSSVPASQKGRREEQDRAGDGEARTRTEETRTRDSEETRTRDSDETRTRDSDERPS